jgi:hypothetical protein
LSSVGVPVPAVVQVDETLTVTFNGRYQFVDPAAVESGVRRA